MDRWDESLPQNYKSAPSQRETRARPDKNSRWPTSDFASLQSVYRMAAAARPVDVVRHFPCSSSVAASSSLLLSRSKSRLASPAAAAASSMRRRLVLGVGAAAAPAVAALAASATPAALGTAPPRCSSPRARTPGARLRRAHGAAAHRTGVGSRFSFFLYFFFFFEVELKLWSPPFFKKYQFFSSVDCYPESKIWYIQFSGCDLYLEFIFNCWEDLTGSDGLLLFKKYSS